MAAYLWQPAVILVFYVLSSFHFRKKGLTVMNFNGRKVPYNFGLVILLWAGLDFVTGGPLSLTPAGFWFVFTVWALGWLDDRFGTAQPKGIRGHFTYLFRQRKLTTGLLKAAGGTAAAFIYAATLVRQESMLVWELPVFLPVLILVPHVFNLLDTRPLRVMKLSVMLLFVVGVFHNGVFYAPGIILLLLIWMKEEGAEKTMLGDNGAMTAGALFATAAAQSGSLPAAGGAALAAVFLTILSEKRSISAIISSSTLLNTMDLAGQRRNR
ncbi:hypothetical protein CR205_08255 [Alteribacter lacisalsi]|uniref:Uncharacterized protein n=1 Tax=Alteribacter lacisalsi TaxID=2045244 RepID=A0A2W0H9P5_9BACI|nr:hypothetical protein [Alteribacter lacisalsi]PYZ98563.1 hypothetical protein CR205_08255 [Alteribacter lacisalsi]